jgi:hypothetical protein
VALIQVSIRPIVFSILVFCQFALSEEIKNKNIISTDDVANLGSLAVLPTNQSQFEKLPDNLLYRSLIEVEILPSLRHEIKNKTSQIVDNFRSETQSAIGGQSQIFTFYELGGKSCGLNEPASNSVEVAKIQTVYSKHTLSNGITEHRTTTSVFGCGKSIPTVEEESILKTYESTSSRRLFVKDRSKKSFDWVLGPQEISLQFRTSHFDGKNLVELARVEAMQIPGGQRHVLYLAGAELFRLSVVKMLALGVYRMEYQRFPIRVLVRTARGGNGYSFRSDINLVTHEAIESPGETFSVLTQDGFQQSMSYFNGKKQELIGDVEGVVKTTMKSAILDLPQTENVSSSRGATETERLLKEMRREIENDQKQLVIQYLDKILKGISDEKIIIQER